MLRVRFFSMASRRLQSSCKEGTPINLNVFKAQEPIVAKKDEEYPEWLWTLLDKDTQLDQLKEEDYFRYRRKILKKDNIKNIKLTNYLNKRK